MQTGGQHFTSIATDMVALAYNRCIQ